MHLPLSSPLNFFLLVQKLLDLLGLWASELVFGKVVINPNSLTAGQGLGLKGPDEKQRPSS